MAKSRIHTCYSLESVAKISLSNIYRKKYFVLFVEKYCYKLQNEINPLKYCFESLKKDSKLIRTSKAQRTI